MPRPSPDVGDLARRLVEHEAGDSPDAAAAAAAIERAFGTLRDDLTDLIGLGGVQALFGRALHLAKRERPLLSRVVAKSDPHPSFDGLAEALAEGSDEQTVETAASILAHVIGLLVLLLGEELGMQPVRRNWSQVASSVREIDE